MKKLVILLIGVVLCSSSVFADNGWGLYGSYWKPSDGEDSFGPGMKIVAEMIEGVLLDFRMAYFDDVLADDAVTSLEVIPLEGGLSLTAPLNERMDIYGGGGVGYYLYDSSDTSVDNEIGYYLAGGLEFTVRKNEAFEGGTWATIFAEVMYRAAKADLKADDGATTDLDLNGAVVNAGLMIRW